MRLVAINRGRTGWACEGEVIEIDGKRKFQGKVLTSTWKRKSGGKTSEVTTIERQNFLVSVNDKGRFKVDIGTGSGVKVDFDINRGATQ